MRDLGEELERMVASSCTIDYQFLFFKCPIFISFFVWLKHFNKQNLWPYLFHIVWLVSKLRYRFHALIEHINDLADGLSINVLAYNIHSSR